MSKNNFLKKENIELLWDVIKDEEIIKKNSNIHKIEEFFNNNLMKFYENEKNEENEISLIDLNKKYIIYITQNIKNNKIINNKILITHEEIQNEKISQFEKDFLKKKQDFENAISIEIPPVPKFNDDIDGPISEMELQIKNMINQRNYELEEINKNFSNKKDKNWLVSQETSIKNDKIKSIKIENETIYFIKNEIIDLNTNLNTNLKKKITWSDNIQYENNETEIDILNKKVNYLENEIEKIKLQFENLIK